MLWVIPAIVGILISFYFIYKINKNRRRNLIKICFSGLFIATILFNSFTIVRHLELDNNVGILLSKGIMTIVPISAILYFLAPYVMMFRSKINWGVVLFFLPVVMLAIMIWYPNIVYDMGVSVRYNYGVNPLLEIQYALVLLIFMSIAPIMYFLVYRKYRDHYGSKLKYFFIGSFFGIVTYLTSLFIMNFIVQLPLIVQSIPTNIGIFFIALGYFKG
jgi:hypothetical protein